MFQRKKQQHHHNIERKDSHNEDNDSNDHQHDDDDDDDYLVGVGSADDSAATGSMDLNLNEKKKNGNTDLTTATKATAATKETRSRTKERQPTLFLPLLILFVLCLLSLLSSYNIISKLNALRFITCIPVMMCAYVGIMPHIYKITTTSSIAITTSSSALIEQTMLPITVVLTFVCGQLPSLIGTMIASIMIIVFSLITIPRNQQRLHRQAPNVSPPVILGGVIILVIVLLSENFLIWVVSATFPASHSVETAPPPLQDNGQIILRQYVLNKLSKYQVVNGLRRLWNVQWSLVSCLGTSFAIIDIYQHPRRQLFSIGLRAVLTLACARFIRTISFLLTVLPSQSKNCYIEHFGSGGPPTDWKTWILIGLRPSSHGGCNDLIISGHATVVSTLCCAVASCSTNTIFQISVWCLVIFDFIIEIYEGFHYSVDMWLGCLLVCLIWRVLAPVEHHNFSNLTKNNNNNNISNNTTTNDTKTKTSVSPKSSTLTPSSIFHDVSSQDVALYSIPAIIAYIQTNFLPQVTANYVIVAYVTVIVFIFLNYVFDPKRPYPSQQEYQHYAQHTMLCLLLITFVTYL